MSFIKKLFGLGSTEQVVSRPDVVSTESSVIDNVIPSVISKTDECLSATHVGEVLLVDGFAEELVICYVVEKEGGRELVSNLLLKKFNATAEDVRKLAFRNFTMHFKTNHQIGEMEFDDTSLSDLDIHTVWYDCDFKPSVMLMDEFWDITVPDVLKADTVAVIIPSVDVCMFMAVRNLEGLRSFKQIANSYYIAGKVFDSEVINNVYVRKNNEWVLFIDTEEQYNYLTKE